MMTREEQERELLRDINRLERERRFLPKEEVERREDKIDRRRSALKREED